MRTRNALVVTLLLAGVALRAEPIPNVSLRQLAEGFTQPVHLVFAPDDGAAYVVEQRGTIRRIAGEKGPHPIFLDIAERVAAGGELGLLGLAFHPDFAKNRRFFVNYTTRKDEGLGTRVSEFTAPPDGQPADPARERVLLRFNQPAANHNGGMLLFGRDGLLYIGTGDGGSANDPHNHGQRLDTLLGKMLRIDVDHAPAGEPYAIPPDNPFVGVPGARPEIYAYGLRNPWRYSFDRANDALWCGDVGQNNREEIDLITRGGNYGWRITEGFLCTPGVNKDCVTNGLIAPIIDYPRSDGASVTGGYVYRGRAYPALQGVYLYADFGSGNIWGLCEKAGRVTEHRRLVTHGPPVPSFAEDAAGELYVVGYNGSIYRLISP